uniref:F-box domain-containing protein n=1 Tax=Amorphochlora amoebiformis TaxID=1561963 RepID=A0A7S0CNZ9_9EUKA
MENDAQEGIESEPSRINSSSSAKVEENNDFEGQGETFEVGIPLPPTNGSAFSRLFVVEGEDFDEDDEEDDEDFDPDNPDEGYSDDSDIWHKRRREDPAEYVPVPKRQRVSGEEKDEDEEEEQPLSTQVLRLSTLIIARVFSFLDLREKLRVSVVCSAWNTPLVNYQVDRLDFKPYPDITDRQIETILPKFHNIVSVRFDDCKNITDKTLDQLGIHCPLLISLGLNRCKKITDEGIKALARCQRLQYLMLWQAEKVTRHSLDYLEKALKHLRTPIHSCD